MEEKAEILRFWEVEYLSAFTMMTVRKLLIFIIRMVIIIISGNVFYSVVVGFDVPVRTISVDEGREHTFNLSIFQPGLNDIDPSVSLPFTLSISIEGEGNPEGIVLYC